MITQATSPFTVVVGLDFRDAGGFAFAQATRIARTIPRSQIHLVHVFEAALDDESRTQLLMRLRLYVNEKAASLGGMGETTVGIHLRVGDPAREIAQLASDLEANMIVLGAHKGPRLKKWLLGSVSERLLLSGACAVVIAGPRPPPVASEIRIEPPCAECVRVRAESKRASWWCPQHASPHPRAHVFSYQRELPFATHDSETIPTGVDMPGTGA